MKTCFEGLVGLSQSECECYTVDAELKESSLNLFVDELEGIDLQLIQNAIKCGEDLSQNFEKLQNNAFNFFQSDLQVAIADSYKQNYKPFTGKLGETKNSATIPSGSFIGLKLDTKHVEGAAIILNSINLFFYNSGTVTLQVYKNDELLDDEYIIEVTPGTTKHTLTTPLILPIYENGIKNEYYFVYDGTGLQPMNNKVSCGCQGVEQLRGKFLTLRGVYGTSIDNYTTKDYAYGLSLNVSISCSIDNMLCDFMMDDTFNRRAGMAIWYKLGVLMIEKLFASREINFDTFSDREYLYGRRNKFEKNYKNIILWLSENTTIDNSNCFVCDSTKTMTMGKNLI